MKKLYFSLDFECGWGAIDTKRWKTREATGVYRDMRPALKTIVKHLSDRQLTFTWACVGALIEDPKNIDISHLKGTYAKQVQHFLESSEPTTQDGRDILDILIGDPYPQRFASHSYSHMRFRDSEQDEAVIRSDLIKARCVNLAKALDAEAFVFPRNEYAALSEVTASGFSNVRMPAYRTELASHIGPVSRLYRMVTSPPNSVIERQRDDGLNLHYASEFFNWGVDANALKRTLVKRRLYRALHACITGTCDVHFWIHPFNLTETIGLFDFALTFFDQIATARDAGKIEIGIF